jgi:hypothetical protein
LEQDQPGCADEAILKYVDSIIGPDRLIEVRIGDEAMRSAVKAELQRRGCQVSQGDEPHILVVVCP